MKTIKILGLTSCLVIAILSVAFGQHKTKAENDTGKANGKGFAVLELFTSEGCSSCPPADEVLAKIQRESQDKPVYLLAYHVDYWDRQGWKDIFSDPDYTNRQVEYSQWLNRPQIYTPQVVVNGKAEFIGSEERTVRKAISEQLSKGSAVTLEMHASHESKNLLVHYQATGAPKGSSLLIAIVQKSAQSQVERGENAGRSLSHVQIVRKLQTESLNTKGDGISKIVLPTDFDHQRFEVLGLVQNNRTGEIVGAAKADLSKS